MLKSSLQIQNEIERIIWQDLAVEISLDSKCKHRCPDALLSMMRVLQNFQHGLNRLNQEVLWV